MWADDVRKAALFAALLAATACTHTIIDVTRPVDHVAFSKRTNAHATVTLSVGIADTPSERQQGLSGVAHLSPGYGLAFLFAKPSTDTFWMKDTLISLSVAFVRADGTIIAIRQMTPCTADPCPTYASPGPYTLAIETAPSWYQANHVVTGSSAVLEPAP
jgi:uncharacterized membrane protein (UPF0127 family)